MTAFSMNSRGLRTHPEGADSRVLAVANAAACATTGGICLARSLPSKPRCPVRGSPPSGCTGAPVANVPKASKRVKTIDVRRQFSEGPKGIHRTFLEHPKASAQIPRRNFKSPGALAGRTG